MTRLQQLHREDGIAMISALLAIVILSGLAVVFVSRATNETRFSAVSRNHETAIHVAEAAADGQIAAMTVDPDHVTLDRNGVVIDFDTTMDERTWALGLLGRMEPVGGDVSAAWRVARDGEAYAVRPRLGAEPMRVIYAVGAVPSFSDPTARIRVIKLQIDRDRHVPEHALLTEAPLTLGGNASIIVPGCEDPSTMSESERLTNCVADVHTNGTFTNPGNASVIQGMVSQAVGTCPSGVTAVNGCKDSSDNVAAIDVPPFRARDFYARNDLERLADWFDLCPDQQVRETVIGGTPCTGAVVWPTAANTSTTFRGWKWQANKWQATAVTSGVFYVYKADAKVTGSGGAGRQKVTVLVDRDGIPNNSAGSLDISGNPNIEAALEGVLFVADADLDLHGTADAGTCGVVPESLSGFIGVGEQLKTQGTVRVRGAIMVQNQSHAHNLVTVSNHGVGGTMCLEFDTELAIDFRGLWVITYWNEI